ncbi:MAG: hypothetical protein IPL94_08705 [Tetrasphaera sp.]|nr:hypothetical protein [Tetrasphaera sp.]
MVYTLTPQNLGPAAALPGWSVTDVLPSGADCRGDLRIRLELQLRVVVAHLHERSAIPGGRRPRRGHGHRDDRRGGDDGHPEQPRLRDASRHRRSRDHPVGHAADDGRRHTGLRRQRHGHQQ